MTLVYRRSGLVLGRGSAPADPRAKALQQDLRTLGYLRSGIDGDFGDGTERAVRALQWDLLHAVQRGSDGEAPVSLRAFNRGRVARVSGILDEDLAACLEDILDDGRVPRLPRSDDPARANREAFASVHALAGLRVPRPFLLAVLLQESGGLHFRLPTTANADDFIVVGLDRNDPGEPDHITSRGYGIGQYTLFHHPPRAEEIETLMLDPGNPSPTSTPPHRSIPGRRRPCAPPSTIRRRPTRRCPTARSWAATGPTPCVATTARA